MTASRRVEAIYPVSPSQQGMLLESFAGGDSSMHLEQVVVEIDAAIDEVALENAWRAVVARHAVLRTAFAEGDNREYLQIVFHAVALPIAREDWRDRGGPSCDERLDRYLETDLCRGFDHSRAPLTRVLLARTGDERRLMVWTFMHVLMDGWSLPIVLGELAECYRALSRGRAIELPAPRPYRDYIAWLRNRDSAAAERYWRKLMTDFNGPTALGEMLALPALPVEGSAHGMIEARVGESVTSILRERIRGHRLTANTMVQGLWGLLLARYSGDGEVVFGITVSGRPPELEGSEATVGLFINTVPLRMRVPEAGSLWTWLETLQQQQQVQREHEYCSPGQIHDWAGLKASTLLYESLLVVENYPAGPAGDAGADEAGFPGVSPRSAGARTRHALTCLVGTDPDLSIRLIYDRRRLAEPEAAKVVRQFCGLFEALAAGQFSTVDEMLAWAGRHPPPRWRGRPGSLRLVPDIARIAPRTAVEVQLVALWERVLGLSAIGVTDNFFDLGGHSLLALHLINAVHETFGMRVPIASLFEAPTIEALARYLGQESDTRPWSALVAIAPDGDRTPIVGIHPLGGNVVCYGELARHLPPDQPLYALQARGMEPDQEPLRTFEAMAESYIVALRTLQPQGPYQLIGYSFGGYVALEMARQLAASGEPISLLGLLDTPNPDIAPEALRHTDSAGLLFSLFAEVLPLDLDHLRRLDEAARIEHVLERARVAHLIPPGSGLDEARRYFEVAQVNHRMHFTPRLCPVRITLFRAREAAERVTTDPALGWTPYAHEGIDIRWVPGKHETMLTGTHAAGLAGSLMDCLSAATESTSS